MTYAAGAGTGGAAAAHQAMVAQAIKASGAIIRVEPIDFQSILTQSENPLVVTSTGGFLNKNYQYLTSYKGLIFFTKSKLPLEMSSSIETIAAKKIWIPQ